MKQKQDAIKKKQLKDTKELLGLKNKQQEI